jgi:hypothetical protein
MGLQTLITMLMGAVVMYYLDPQLGGRRRALLRDQMIKVMNRVQDDLDNRAEDMQKQARGMAIEAVKRIGEEKADNVTMASSIRTKMGRIVSHPGAVNVMVEGNTITLTGDILANEVQPFVTAVKEMSGNRQVDNQLTVHEDAANVPGLQGKKTRKKSL